MLHIKTQGAAAPFDLNADTEVSLTHTNPILDKDGIDRVFSLPIVLPATARNVSIRQFTNRLDAKAKAPTRATIHFAGHLLRAGTLKQTSSALEKEEVQFISETVDIWKALEKLKLSTILEDITVSTVGVPNAVWVFSINTPSIGLLYSVQLGNGTATYTATSTDPLEIQIAANSLATALNLLVPGIATVVSGDLHLSSVLINQYNIINWQNITEESVTTAGERAQIAMTNHVNDVLTNGSNSHTFPAFVWWNLYGYKAVGSVVGDFEDRVNAWADGVLLQNEPFVADEYYQNKWKNTLIPMCYVAYVLERIRIALGGEYADWRGDTWEHPDFQSLVVVNNFTLDAVYDDRYSNSFSRINGYTPNINLNNHVPDITAAVFIKEVCTSLNVSFSAKENSLYLQPNRAPLTKPPLDWRGRTSNLFNRVTNPDNGWTLKYGPNNDQIPYPVNQLQPMTSGNGEAERVLIPTCLHRSDIGIMAGTGLAKLPQLYQVAQSRAVNGDHKRSTLPLMWIFDRGLQLTSTGSEYRLATHDALNFALDTVGEWSLDIQADNGLYEVHHKGHIELSDSDEITFEILLNIGELNVLTQWRNAHIRAYHSLGEFTGVIKALDSKYTAKGMGLVAVKVLKE